MITGFGDRFRLLLISVTGFRYFGFQFRFPVSLFRFRLPVSVVAFCLPVLVTHRFRFLVSVFGVGFLVSISGFVFSVGCLRSFSYLSFWFVLSCFSFRFGLFPVSASGFGFRFPFHRYRYTLQAIPHDVGPIGCHCHFRERRVPLTYVS